jgi:hypothetical protein
MLASLLAILVALTSLAASTQASPPVSLTGGEGKPLVKYGDIIQVAARTLMVVGRPLVPVRGEGERYGSCWSRWS